MRFPNYAGRSDIDNELAIELGIAKINVEKLPEIMRKNRGEVKSIVVGTLHGWSFERAWYYWVATGPGIPVDEAMMLHESFGKDVRVAGHCGCTTPFEWYKGLACGSYHVDTVQGLQALAKTIKSVVETAQVKYGKKQRQSDSR